MDKIVLVFDMTGYHPGSASMTGWLVNNFLRDGKPQGEYSLQEILEGGRTVVRIKNFHRLGFVYPMNIAEFLLDIQRLIQKGITFEFEEIYSEDNKWQLVR